MLLAPVIDRLVTAFAHIRTHTRSRPYKISPQAWSQLHHFASFPQTGISLRQMVQFGRNPNPGTILQAGTFLAGEPPLW